MRSTSRRHGLRIVGLALACSLPMASAQAAAIWPSGPWTPLTVGGGDYTDSLGDENPSSVDLVGGDDGSNSYTAGFWTQCEIDDQLSLRMRLDADGDGDNNVWQFLFDTDGDASSIDWVLEVRQSGSPSAREVVFTQTSVSGPTFGDVALSETFAWTGSLADWSRWAPVDDGSLFGADADYFLDTAIPLTTFRSLTGLSASDSFRLGLSTSTSHTQINKDLPLGLAPVDPVSSAFADSPVPEPGTGALVALGLCALGVGVRSRGNRPRA